MGIKSEVFKSPAFIASEVTIAVIFLLCAVFFPATGLLLLVIFMMMSAAIYTYVEQKLFIAKLQSELIYYRAKEDEFIVRTEQLRRALHDIRSPMSAIRLRLQLIQKSDSGVDSKHMTRMEESLSAAFEHIQYISDIQKGNVKPTETLLMRVNEIRSQVAK